MRTVIIIVGGFLLLGVCLLAGRFIGGTAAAGAMVTAAKAFIAIWLIAAGINMWIGIAKAGYPVVEELPIFLLIFAVPAGAAAFVWRNYS